MKQLMAAMALTAMLLSCGGKTQTAEKESTSEEEIASEIVNSLEETKSQINQSTEEALSEVDSLLENL